MSGASNRVGSTPEYREQFEAAMRESREAVAAGVPESQVPKVFYLYFGKIGPHLMKQIEEQIVKAGGMVLDYIEAGEGVVFVGDEDNYTCVRALLTANGDVIDTQEYDADAQYAEILALPEAEEEEEEIILLGGPRTFDDDIRHIDEEAA